MSFVVLWPLKKSVLFVRWYSVGASVEKPSLAAVLKFCVPPLNFPMIFFVRSSKSRLGGGLFLLYGRSVRKDSFST